MTATTQERAIMATRETTPPRVPPRWFVPRGLAGPSSALQSQWRPVLVDDFEQTRVGRDAPHDDRSEVEARAQCDRRLRRRWSESDPDRHEWLGRRASFVVAQPPGGVRRCVRLSNQVPRPVRARRAEGAELDRLWRRWAAVLPELDRFAGARSNDTPVIVLEPGAAYRPADEGATRNKDQPVRPRVAIVLAAAS